MSILYRTAISHILLLLSKSVYSTCTENFVSFAIQNAHFQNERLRKKSNKHQTPQSHFYQLTIHSTTRIQHIVLNREAVTMESGDEGPVHLEIDSGDDEDNYS